MDDKRSEGRLGVTGLLIDWSRGDRAALEKLAPIDHTLQPTALVNELYLRLVEQRRASWKDRAHFFAVAAQMMRRILVDHARAQVAAKRGGSSPRVPLDEALEIEFKSAFEVLAVDGALTRLAEMDSEQARVVALRFFSGLT